MGDPQPTSGESDDNDNIIIAIHLSQMVPVYMCFQLQQRQCTDQVSVLLYLKFFIGR